MTRTIKATAVIEGKDRTGAAFKSAAQNAMRLRAQMERTNSIMAATNKMVSVGGGVLGGALSVNAAKNALTRYAEVDRTLTRIGITGEATRVTMEGIGSQLRDSAVEMALPYAEAEKGLNAMAAAGVKVDDAMSFMPTLMRTAQGTGAAVEDTAKTIVAVMRNMKLGASDMGESMDILAILGKAGEFEFKDMAKYLQSILPAARALGYTGQDGLTKVGAMLQSIRAGTGSAEEAATALNNIFQKMESEETVGKFKKMGVDLRKVMTDARRDGKDLVETFQNAVMKATKGDMSKLPQLIGDMQFGTGTRALHQFVDGTKELIASAKNAKGTIQTDVNRVLNDTDASVKRVQESWDRLTTALGKRIAVNIDLSGIPKWLQHFAKRAEGTEQIPWQEKTWADDHSRTSAEDEEQKRADYSAALQKQEEDSAAIVASLNQQIENMRGQKGPVADDRRAGLQKQIEMASIALTQAAINKHNVRKFETTPSLDLMRQMPIDAYEEGNRLKGTLPDATRARSKGTMRDIPLPQPRPASLGRGFANTEVSALDDATAKRAIAAMDELKGKTGEVETKAAAVVTEVTKIGPAGQAAGQQAAAGSQTFLQKWLADIATVQAALNGMTGPKIAGAAIGSAFNTGKSTGGVE
jgi:TP901 family phage tail tape measure protein